MGFQIDRATTLGEALKVTLGTAVSESSNALSLLKAMNRELENTIDFLGQEEGRTAINEFFGLMAEGAAGVLGTVVVMSRAFSDVTNTLNSLSTAIKAADIDGFDAIVPARALFRVATNFEFEDSRNSFDSIDELASSLQTKVLDAIKSARSATDPLSAEIKAATLAESIAEETVPAMMQILEIEEELRKGSQLSNEARSSSATRYRCSSTPTGRCSFSRRAAWTSSSKPSWRSRRRSG